MSNYYIKFAKYPFAYAVVKTSNSSNALSYARRFRRDAIVVNPSDKLFTFEDAVKFGNKWHRVDLEYIEDKNHYEVYQVNQELPGVVLIEESKEILTINPNKIISWAKTKTGKDGVIWAKDGKNIDDSKNIVFGNKVKGEARPLLVFVKFNPKMLK